VFIWAIVTHSSIQSLREVLIVKKRCGHLSFGIDFVMYWLEANVCVAVNRLNY
jgi:hypothetical protein